MKWFKHDSNAHIDAKLKKVKHKYGIVGYGLYWYCIELIAMGVDRNNISFELEEDSETISLEWNLDQLRVQEIMEYMVHLNLFENQDGRITCLKLAKRLDDTNSKNPEIKRVLDELADKPKPEEVPNEPDLLGDAPKDSAQIRSEEIRLEIKNKFNEFWMIYPNKQKKSIAQETWGKKITSLDQVEEIIEHVKKRKVSDQQWIKNNGQFIPLPTTFLNQKLWEDEYKVATHQAANQQAQIPNRRPVPKAGTER